MANPNLNTAVTSMKFGNPQKGKASGCHIFQYNKLLNDYQYFSDNFFKIRLQAFEAPYQAVDSKKQSLTATSPSNTAILDLELLYSGQSFNVSHQHEWGSSDSSAVGNLIKKIGSGQGDFSNIGKVDLAIDAATQAWTGDSVKAIDSSSKLGQSLFTPNRFGKIEVANAYKGSTSQTFNITTTFIASSDPYKDVVFPCKILESIGYPTLVQDSALLSAARSTASAVVGSNVISKVKKSTDEDSKIKQVLQNSTKGTFSARYGKVPPVWNVMFSNNLHGLSSCALTAVNVEYYGPWIKKPNESEVEKSIARLNNGANADFNDIAKSIYEDGDKLTAKEFDAKNGRKGGFPSFATVTLTFTDTFNNPFQEDILRNLYGNLDTMISVESNIAGSQ